MADASSNAFGFPWPQKGDQLISSDPGHPLNAWLSDQTGSVAYIEGYKRAAEIIWQQVEVSPREAGIDYLVFPMVFLFRHYTELCLKGIIAVCSYIKTAQGEYPTHHSLMDLWRSARSRLEEIGPGCSAETLDSMAEMIRQLDQIDPGSFSFRYYVTKDLKPALPQTDGLNLAVFHEGMAKMINFFEGAQSMLSDYKSNVEHSW